MLPRPLMFLLALLPAACGGGDAAPAPADSTLSASEDLDTPQPERLQRDLETVETWSEQVANNLLEFSDKLRRRDYAGARRWLADDFRGSSWAALPAPARADLPLASTRLDWDVTDAPGVGPDEFLASLATHIGPWQHVEGVLFKVKGADFEAGLTNLKAEAEKA